MMYRKVLFRSRSGVYYLFRYVTVPFVLLPTPTVLPMKFVPVHSGLCDTKHRSTNYLPTTDGTYTFTTTILPTGRRKEELRCLVLR